MGEAAFYGLRAKRSTFWRRAMNPYKATEKSGLRPILTGGWLSVIDVPTSRNGSKAAVIHTTDAFIAVRTPLVNAPIITGRGRKNKKELVWSWDDVPQGWIPPEALRAIASLSHDRVWTVDAFHVTVGRAHFDRDPGPAIGDPGTKAKFPLVEALAPEIADHSTLRLAFNPTLLKQAADALGIGNQGVEVLIDLDETTPIPSGPGQEYVKAMKVLPLDSDPEDHRMALTMPMRHPRKVEPVDYPQPD